MDSNNLSSFTTFTFMNQQIPNSTQESIVDTQKNSRVMASQVPSKNEIVINKGRERSLSSNKLNSCNNSNLMDASKMNGCYYDNLANYSSSSSYSLSNSSNQKKEYNTKNRQLNESMLSPQIEKREELKSPQQLEQMSTSIKSYLDDKNSSYLTSNFKNENTLNDSTNNNDSVVAKMMNKKMNDFREQVQVQITSLKQIQQKCMQQQKQVDEYNQQESERYQQHQIQYSQKQSEIQSLKKDCHNSQYKLNIQSSLTHPSPSMSRQQVVENWLYNHHSLNQLINKASNILQIKENTSPKNDISNAILPFSQKLFEFRQLKCKQLMEIWEYNDQLMLCNDRKNMIKSEFDSISLEEGQTIAQYEELSQVLDTIRFQYALQISFLEQKQLMEQKIKMIKEDIISLEHQDIDFRDKVNEDNRKIIEFQSKQQELQIQLQEQREKSYEVLQSFSNIQDQGKYEQQYYKDVVCIFNVENITNSIYSLNNQLLQKQCISNIISLQDIILQETNKILLNASSSYCNININEFQQKKKEIIGQLIQDLPDLREDLSKIYSLDQILLNLRASMKHAKNKQDYADRLMSYMQNQSNILIQSIDCNNKIHSLTLQYTQVTQQLCTAEFNLKQILSKSKGNKEQCDKQKSLLNQFSDQLTFQESQYFLTLKNSQQFKEQWSEEDIENHKTQIKQIENKVQVINQNIANIQLTTAKYKQQQQNLQQQHNQYVKESSSYYDSLTILKQQLFKIINEESDIVEKIMNTIKEQLNNSNCLQFTVYSHNNGTIMELIQQSKQEYHNSKQELIQYLIPNDLSKEGSTESKIRQIQNKIAQLSSDLATYIENYELQSLSYEKHKNSLEQEFLSTTKTRIQAENTLKHELNKMNLDSKIIFSTFNLHYQQNLSLLSYHATPVKPPNDNKSNHSNSNSSSKMLPKYGRITINISGISNNEDTKKSRQQSPSESNNNLKTNNSDKENIVANGQEIQSKVHSVNSFKQHINSITSLTNKNNLDPFQKYNENNNFTSSSNIKKEHYEPNRSFFQQSSLGTNFTNPNLSSQLQQEQQQGNSQISFTSPSRNSSFSKMQSPQQNANYQPIIEFISQPFHHSKNQSMHSSTKIQNSSSSQSSRSPNRRVVPMSQNGGSNQKKKSLKQRTQSFQIGGHSSNIGVTVTDNSQMFLSNLNSNNCSYNNNRSSSNRKQSQDFSQRKLSESNITLNLSSLQPQLQCQQFKLNDNHISSGTIFHKTNNNDNSQCFQLDASSINYPLSRMERSHSILSTTTMNNASNNISTIYQTPSYQQQQYQSSLIQDLTFKIYRMLGSGRENLIKKQIYDPLQHQGKPTAFGYGKRVLRYNLAFNQIELYKFENTSNASNSNDKNKQKKKVLEQVYGRQQIKNISVAPISSTILEYKYQSIQNIKLLDDPILNKLIHSNYLPFSIDLVQGQKIECVASSELDLQTILQLFLKWK